MAGPWEQYQQPAATGPWTQYQQAPSEVPGPRRAWSDVPMEAVTNVLPSASKLVGGLYEAVTSPVQTVKGMFQLAGGAAFAALPQQAQDWLISTASDPEKVKQSIAMAKAVGGEYAKRYGSEEGFKEALATDPVGVVSDFSTLLTGGAAATGKVAPTVSKALGTAAAYTNPMALVAKPVEYGLGLGAKGAGNVIDALQGQRAQVRAGNIIRNALTEEGRTPANLLAAQQAIQNAPPGSTVRQALADVVSPQVQYLGKIVESETAPGAAMATQQAQEAARAAKLKAASPDLAAAEAVREATAKQLYGISDEALLPGRERQFKPVQAGVVEGGVPMIDPITGQPRMAPVATTAKAAPGAQVRQVQVEVGRDSFNQPIYETRAVPAAVPTGGGAQASDFLTNVPKMAQEVSVGGQPIYKQVLAGYKYDPQLAKLMDRPAIQAAFDSAASIAANKGVPMFTESGQLTGRGAHLVKLAIDDAINPTPGTPIARNTANALRSAKADYLNWVETQVPAYKTARETFKLQSEPVNQAQVLNAMQSVLEAPLGVGERAGAFMTAMGRGEKALLKKATGEARYSELSDVLTPSQMKVVGEVESELMRDARVAAQTKAGAEAMNAIMEANKSKFRLPDFMSVKVTLANQMLRLLEGRLNAKVMNELEKGFSSGTSFVDLMKKVPASERIEVLRALGEAKGQLSPTKMNLLSQSQNALAPAQENRNALAQ